jgi:group I intron endonuclease
LDYPFYIGKSKGSDLVIIYKATNLVNGKSYIGQTCRTLEERIYEHWVGNPGNGYFQNALKKNGIEGFKYSILDNSEDRGQLNLKEEFWINFFNTPAPNGHNLRTGGNAWTLTEQARNNMSLGKKNMPEENRKAWIGKLRQYNLGKEAWNKGKMGIYNEEARWKMGASTRGKIRTVDGYILAEKLIDVEYKKPAIYMSEEHKQKLREANLGKHHTEESKEKCRIAGLKVKNRVIPHG